MERIDHLIEEQIPRLRRYARALTGDGCRADDLVQDTLERAWGRLNLWRRGSDIRAWLFTIMHNVYVNEVRKSRAAGFSVELDDEALQVSVRASQEDALVLRDLTAALRSLPFEQREVLLLAGLEQMPYKEIANVLNIPSGTVMSRLARGRERLRELMAGQAGPALRLVK
ncbi:MAG: RNA polymerase sigma factor [Sulfuricellaceae bacterium]|nr:RNA polymerase sigma factor [Sulfuricellaceae bacterium]